MNSPEVRLISLLDILRRDSGVSNALGALEQLSLLLLLKYFHNLVEPTKVSPFSSLSFAQTVLTSISSRDENNGIDFVGLRKAFNRLAIVAKDSYTRPWFIGINDETIREKVAILLGAIPFRIQSGKVLERLLFELETLEFDESFGDAYDALIEKVVDNSVAAGEYRTPKALVVAIVQAVAPSQTNSIYDPAMGTGSFLLEAMKWLVKKHNYESSLQGYVVGQDVSTFACLVGTLRLLINGIHVGEITLGNSLLDNNPQRFDIILSTLPFGRKTNGDREGQTFSPNSDSAEESFLMHILKKLSSQGKAALVVPDRILFGKTNELKDTRYRLLTQFNLHTVLSLPAGVLAPYSGIKVSVLFFDECLDSEHIWFYELKTSKVLGKNYQIRSNDFENFIFAFPNRIESENSCLIRKSDILKGEWYSLPTNLPLRIVEKREDILASDVLSDLDEKKQAINHLWLKLKTLLSHEPTFAPSEKTTLGKLIKLTAGKFLTKDEINESGKYPVYGGNGLIGFYDRFNLSGINVIVGRVGANCGNVHIVSTSIWLTDNSFFVEVSNSAEVYLPFLAHALRGLNLKSYARGTAQPSISNSSVKEIEIDLPSYDKQIQMANWFDEIQVTSDELQGILNVYRADISQFVKQEIGKNLGMI